MSTFLLGKSARHLQLAKRHQNVLQDQFVRTLTNFNTSNIVNCSAFFLNQEIKKGLLISEMTNDGFMFNNGHFVNGSIALFPNTVLRWNVATAEKISKSSLSLFEILDPKPDVLVIGTGENKVVDPEIIKYLKEKKITYEIETTTNAVGAYNFLLGDDKYVVAVLIKPERVDTPQTRTHERMVTRLNKESEDEVSGEIVSANKKSNKE